VGLGYKSPLRLESPRGTSAVMNVVLVLDRLGSAEIGCSAVGSSAIGGHRVSRRGVGRNAGGRLGPGSAGRVEGSDRRR
jgi:hypothetical protein